MTTVDGSRRRFLGFARPAQREHNAMAAAPAVPRFDAARCNACDACMRVCAPRALSLDTAAPAYRIEPVLCDGCALCVDVCDRDAIALAPDTGAGGVLLALQSMLCAVCGAEFRVPAGTGSGRCRICSRTGAAKNRLRIRE